MSRRKQRNDIPIVERGSIKVLQKGEQVICGVKLHLSKGDIVDIISNKIFVNNTYICKTKFGQDG